MERVKDLPLKWKYIGIIVGVFLSCLLYVGKDYRHSGEVIYEWDNLSLEQGEIREQGNYIDETNGTACEWIVLDNLSIMKGSYDVMIDYETDTDNNRFYLTWTENTYQALKMDISTLYHNQNKVKTCAWVDDSRDDYRFAVEYKGSGSLAISQIRIVRNVNRSLWRGCVAFGLVLAGLFVYALRRRNKVKCVYDGEVIFGICVITFIASLIFCTDYLQNYHDLNYHLVRIESLKEQLRSGHLYPEVSGYWLNGYGYATNIMYNEILLFLPAVLRIMGCTIMTAYKSYAVFMNALTCLFSYLCVKHITKDKYISLIGSAIYTLASFRIFDLARHAVGEYSAITFLPLIIGGIYMIITAEEKKDRSKGIFYAVVGYSGVIGSHVITLMFVAVFSIVAAMLLIRKVLRKEVFTALVKMVIYTVLLNMYWFIPFFEFLFTENMQVGGGGKIQKSSIQLVNLFLGFDGATGGNYDSDYPVSVRTTWNLGLSIILGVVIFLFFLFHKKKVQDKKLWKCSVVCMITGGLAAWMATVTFPFDNLMDWFPVLIKIFGSIQFSWRLLSIATALLTFGTCTILLEIKLYHRKEMYQGLFIVMSICVFIPYFYQFGALLHNDRPSIKIYDVGGLNCAEVVGGEYLIEGTDIDRYHKNQYDISDNVELITFQKNGTDIIMNISETESKDGTIVVPLMYYRHYEAIDCKNHTELKTYCGDNNRVTVEIPKGYSGKIHVKYHTPWYWILAEIVSVSCVLLWIIYRGYVRRYEGKKSKKSIYLSVLALVLMILACSLVTQ